MPRRTPPHSARPRLVLAAISAALLACWLVPGQAASENRSPAQFPVLNRSGLQTAEYFRGVDAAVSDRLGLKGDIVRVVNGALVEAGLSPSASVVRAPDGEPYFAGDFTGACANASAVSRLGADLDRVADELAREGAAFLYAVAPDKSSAQRDDLGPVGALLLRCADRNRAVLEDLAAEGAPLLVAWDRFDAAGDDLFIYGDSHWNADGAALFTDLLLTRLVTDGRAPADLMRNGAVVATQEDHYGDLFRLMGVEQVERIDHAHTLRSGVTTVTQIEDRDGIVSRRWQSTGDAAFVEGRTLVLHDSFFEYGDELLAPYFRDLTSLPFSAVSDPGALAAAGPYDLVIVYQVQRSVPIFLDAVPDADWITGG